MYLYMTVRLEIFLENRPLPEILYTVLVKTNDTKSRARARNPNTLLRFSRIFNVPSFSLQWIFPWFTNSKRRWYPILLLNKDKWFQWYHSNLNFLAIFSWIWFDQATLCGFWIQSRLQNVRWHLDVCSSDKTPSSLS